MAGDVRDDSVVAGDDGIVVVGGAIVVAETVVVSHDTPVHTVEQGTWAALFVTCPSCRR